MANNTNMQTPASTQNTQTPSTSGNSGNNKMLLYIIAAVAIIVVVIAIVLLVSSGSSTTTGLASTLNHSENTTPVYMSAVQTQDLLGSSVSNYFASDLFNPNSQINMSDLESFVPQLAGNATSGWVSSGDVSNATYNVSVQYYVLKGSNTKAMAQALSSAMTSSVNLTAQVVTPGTYNGLSYTYGLYENSTSDLQILYGVKDNNAVVMVLFSSPIYVANQTQFIDIAANDTT